MPKRLDQAILQHYSTRTKAQDAIKNGRVFVNGKQITKNAYPVEESDTITFQEEIQYVSRAAHKLEAVFEKYQPKIEGKVVLDIGASTGGFTQVCLLHGAKKVYALDVGHLQLAKALEEDERVIKMEGKNAREIGVDEFNEPIEFLCMDVSFISAKTILDHVFSLAWPTLEEVVVLVKPQFECGPQALNKNGVLKNPKLRAKIIEDMKTYMRQFYRQVDALDSPLPGRSGNVEALIYARGKR